MTTDRRLWPEDVAARRPPRAGRQYPHADGRLLRRTGAAPRAARSRRTSRLRTAGGAGGVPRTAPERTWVESPWWRGDDRGVAGAARQRGGGVGLLPGPRRAGRIRGQGVMSVKNRQRRERNRASSAARAWFEEAEAAPEVRAHLRKQASPTQARAIITGALPSGDPAPRAAYVCRYRGKDGAGCWDQPRRGLRIVHSRPASRTARSGACVGVAPRPLPAHLGGPRRPVVPVPGPSRRRGRRHPGAACEPGRVAHVRTCLTADTVPDFTHGLATI